MEQNQYENKTDQELVELTLANQDNFLYLMKRYEKAMLKYILRLTNISYEDAEDLVQDVFIKIYQNLNNYDQKLKFSSWIYRITHNHVISNHRKLKARPESKKVDLDNNIIENLATNFDLNKQTDLEFMKKNINYIIDKLDYKYKEVIILKFIEEKSYQEISDIIKKPPGTIATLINRAKKQFKKIASKEKINLL